MTWSAFAGFLIAVALGAMVPGSTTALVIRQSAVGGVRVAFPLVAGIEIGTYVWVVASAVGVAAVVAASPTAYTVLRIVGAGVLIFLGVQAWLAARRITDEEPTSTGQVVFGRWPQVALTGAVTQLSNPKLMVFMVAFYPQFIPAEANVLLITLLLGLVQVLVDGGWYLLVAAFVGRARNFFAKAKIRKRLERVTGTVLIGLGVRMAVSKL